MALSHINNVALSGLSAINGQTLSGLSEILGQTIGAGGGGVTWTGTVNAIHSAGTISKDVGSGTAGRGTSVETISSAGSGYFEMDSTAVSPGAHFDISMGPASGSPYSGRPSSNGVYVIFQDAFLEIRDQSDFSYQTNTSYTPGTDIVRIGFDGSGHMQVWKNGSIVFTDDEVVSSADQVLIILFDSSGASGIGIENVVIGP